MYGDAYLPLYSMVTFSHTPYADAQRYGHQQDDLLKTIMSVDGMRERWDSSDMEPVIRKHVDAFLLKRT